MLHSIIKRAQKHLKFTSTTVTSLVARVQTFVPYVLCERLTAKSQATHPKLLTPYYSTSHLNNVSLV